MSFNERWVKRKEAGIGGSTEVEGDVREMLGRVLRCSFLRNFLLLAASSTPFVTSAFDPGPVSYGRRKLLLSMPRHACRATASPLILRLRLWFKLPVRISMPDRTFGALLLRTGTAVSIRTFSVTSANVGCYKRRDGHDTLFGYEIDAFHRSLLSSRRCIAPFIGSDWSDTRYCCYVVYRIKNDCAYVNTDAILYEIHMHFTNARLRKNKLFSYHFFLSRFYDNNAHNHAVIQ